MIDVENQIQLGLPIDSFANDAKCWVYTAKNELTDKNVSHIKQLADVFLSQWDSHGKKLKGAFLIKEKRFLVILADAEGDDMCGRAQDAQLKFVKELEQVTNNIFIDRMLVAYNDKEAIKVLPFTEIKTKVTEGVIAKDNLFYNGLIQTKSDFLSNWIVPIENSWLD